MTAQFADVSVGSGRAKFKGWNTVIVRTEAGAMLVEKSKTKGIIETRHIPDENLAHLKRAAINKMKKAIEYIMVRTGSKCDLGYLKIKPEIHEKLRNE
jgi:coenzyme F420-reducing hydrogenase beta subunit